MAPVPLNVSPALRPWRQAGVTHLLLDEATQARLLTSAPAQPEPTLAPEVRPAPQTSQTSEISRASDVRRAPQTSRASEINRTSDVRRAPEPAAAKPVPPSRSPGATPRTLPAQRPAPQRPEPAEPVSRQIPENVPAALPLEQWPRYWKALLALTPAHPALIWTYPSLSRDLGGDVEVAHRDFLRRLLGDMGLPKGSHAFWPLNSYPYAAGESEQTVNAAMFMSGVSMLNPDTVILLSGTVPPELGVFGGEKLTALRPLMPDIVQGRRFVVTPHVDALIQDTRRYAQLISFLKSLRSGR